MTISALRKACFSVVHKQVGTCATCVHHIHKHVVPNESAVALDGYLAHTLPSSHGHPELCFRPLCENTGMKQGEVQRWGQGRGKPHPFPEWPSRAWDSAWRIQGLVSGPEALLVRCLIYMWVHGSIKLLGSEAPSHGWKSRTSSVRCYPASLRSGCQKPQSFSPKNQG